MTTCNNIPAAEEALGPERPEQLAIDAAWRLLELQARDAAGWAEPAMDYGGGDPELEPQLGLMPVERVTFTAGTPGTKEVPALLPAAMELMQFKELLLVFTAAKEASEQAGVGVAGAVWWAVRMEERRLGDVAREAGLVVADARQAMLAYEAAIITGLRRVAEG